MHLKMGILSFSLLFLGLVSLSQSFQSCPEEEDVYPCTCGHTHFTGELVLQCFAYRDNLNLEKLRKIVTSLSGKKEVQINLYRCPWSEANVTLPSDLFSGVGVKKLELELCKIKGFTIDNQPSLLGLENDLEELQLDRSLMVNNVPSVLNFGHLKKLRVLYLLRNEIKELGNDWINAPASLEKLDMWRNSIEKIGDRAFANLVNLRKFHFEADHLPSLKRSMFPNPATKLDTLHLVKTRISTLPEDIFSNMPALKHVNLFYNGISTIDQRTWQPVWNQLYDIDLTGCPIKCDASLDWIIANGKRPLIVGNCEDQVKGEYGILEYIKSKAQE